MEYASSLGQNLKPVNFVTWALMPFLICTALMLAIIFSFVSVSTPWEYESCEQIEGGRKPDGSTLWVNDPSTCVIVKRSGAWKALFAGLGSGLFGLIMASMFFKVGFWITNPGAMTAVAVTGYTADAASGIWGNRR